MSLLRPVCGLEAFAEVTLASSFTLDYPHYELLLCVARADDPVLPLLTRLVKRYPHVSARILIGDQRVNTNPKLNNLLKGWDAAAHAWVAIADSNVMMPPDYLQRLLARWNHDTGLVCSPPAGSQPKGFWAHVECAFLNSYQARFQYCADTAGMGFAQGKTMLWRRADLDAVGGIAALACETAEDAAATKVVRKMGLQVQLVDAPFAQPLGRRRMREVWNRQVRWARLRRASFARLYACEIAAGGLLPIAAAVLAAGSIDLPVTLIGGLAVALWYGSELALAYAAGWPLAWHTLPAMIVRDVMLPGLWLQGWLGSRFVWRGTAMTAEA